MRPWLVLAQRLLKGRSPTQSWKASHSSAVTFALPADAVDETASPLHDFLFFTAAIVYHCASWSIERPLHGVRWEVPQFVMLYATTEKRRPGPPGFPFLYDVRCSAPACAEKAAQSPARPQCTGSPAPAHRLSGRVTARPRPGHRLSSAWPGAPPCSGPDEHRARRPDVPVMP